MRTLLIASVLIGTVVIPATLAELEAQDLGKDWLADARKDKNENLEQAILKGIQILKQLADQVDDTSKIRVYDVILKARPGREGWDLYMNVNGAQACKISLKRDHGKEIELDVLSGCAKGGCPHHQKVSCQSI